MIVKQSLLCEKCISKKCLSKCSEIATLKKIALLTVK